MSLHAEIVPSVVDRIKRTLVSLKMPRALEIVDATVRRIERGEVTPLEAIDMLLVEELTLRENRRVRMALQMAKLSAVKTLAGFDFSSSPRSTATASWRSPNCSSSTAARSYTSLGRPAPARAT